jgi:hypothetical protein
VGIKKQPNALSIMDSVFKEYFKDAAVFFQETEEKL